MTEKKGLPPWVWVGCGCVGAIAILVVSLVGLGFWGAQKARELGETMADPAARRDKALELLGADALPEGYYAVAAFSVPFVFDIAVLSDQPPDDDGAPNEFVENGFIFTTFPAIGDGDDELFDFFEGRTDDVGSLKRERFDVDLDERLAHGRMERADDVILWVSHRGAVATENRSDTHEGLVTMLLVDCDDDRRRIGIWFGPELDADEAGGELDVSGTVADVSEIEAFMRPFAPCR